MERMPRTQRHAMMVSSLAKPLLEDAAAALHPRLAGEKTRGHAGGFPERARHPATKRRGGRPAGGDGRREIEGRRGNVVANIRTEAVAVYLNAFNDMNDASWANLKTMLESDPRLQLGTH